jgi:Replication-relaxation
MASLTERDNDVLLAVYRYRYLTTSQIARLYFPSQRTAQRRLVVLAERRLLSHFTVPNITDRIYLLTSRGAGHVSGLLSVEPEDLLWSQRNKPPKDYYFMQHFAAISDFRIAITRACESSEITLLGFIPEHYGAKHPSGRVTKYIKDVAFSVADPKEKISHTPDAVFALEKAGKPALFFLEIDRGTETIANPEKGIAKMVRFYEAYAEEGKYRGYTQDFDCSPFQNFRLLIVTTTRRRVQNIRTALGKSGSPLHRFFWLTTYDELDDESVFDRRWVSLDDSDSRSYGIT